MSSGLEGRAVSGFEVVVVREVDDQWTTRQFGPMVASTEFPANAAMGDTGLEGLYRGAVR
jgi:hypothetical protein